MKKRIICIYVNIYHTWKKFGILATGCRRYGAKNDAKWQKKDVKLPKSAQNQRKNSRNRQGEVNEALEH